MSKVSSNITFILLTAVVVLTVAVGCGACGGGERTVRGVVVEVEARSISEVAYLTIEEQGSGKVWTFQADGFVGFTPSHIREHMMQGQAVTVLYQERDGVFFAVLVTD
jgi:hypothetical protein